MYVEFNYKVANKPILILYYIYIRQLNMGKAAGADGLTTEHYVYAIGSSVPLHISSMLTLCLQHGLVPETFLHGVLIRIYKTGKD